MTERKKLVNKLDKVFGDFIKQRDGRRCVVCGSTERITCGHLFSRVAYSTRWDELNCHAQCMTCNMSHEYDSYPFNNWFITKFGKDTWDKLHRQYVTPKKFKDYDLQELLDRYKSAIIK